MSAGRLRSLARAATWLLILHLAASVDTDVPDAERWVGEGCLVLDGRILHEFGSEMPFVHVALAECAAAVSSGASSPGALAEAEIAVLIDGEETQTFPFREETIRLTLPLLPPGPHEAVISLRFRAASEHAGGAGRVVDERVFPFYSSDFQPQAGWGYFEHS
ncbi:hypothetical protein T484DRAFT_1805263 [Baffinella frigidus]|nr:hypothetical protein T484DRAFT_1805263 [Cryptophyta sp. CCMP2293]